tara:strand:+ start:13316 stop:13510 length:195 start_codon:yes stop_codon:yes gene_type:complete
MVTTIQVTEEVLDYLKHYRDRSSVESYNEVIKNMIKTISKQDSMFGFLGKKSMKGILKDLRDDT